MSNRHWVYYNDSDPSAAAWLDELRKRGLIPDGYVDYRDIRDVHPDDIRHFTHCHFFAGIGGWAEALRLAQWPADRPVWTGSCPCQPFSAAGKRKGIADDRHLWPDWFNLIRQCRPSTIFGEQVSQAIRFGWLDGVYVDLESCGYAVGAAVLPACSVDAPHKRERLWFVADLQGERREPRPWAGEAMGTGESWSIEPEGRHQIRVELADSTGRRTTAIQQPRQTRCAIANGQSMADGGGARLAQRTGFTENARQERTAAERSCGLGVADGRRRTQRLAAPTAARHGNPTESASGFWSNAEWVVGPDGKARRVKPGVSLLAHGVSGRVAKLRGLGNAIVPQVAAQMIRCFV